jgi:hypothetical protein
MLGKLTAILSLAATALVPVVIVTIWHRMGAVWVTGYVAGIFTVPLVGIGAMRAMNELFEDTKAFASLVAFGVAVIVMSLVAATFAFLL